MVRHCTVVLCGILLAVHWADADDLAPLSRGQCWSEAGRSWRDQVEACSDIIDPRLLALPAARAQAYFNRGWARLFLCDYELSIRDFGAALLIDPGYAPYAEGLAEAMRRRHLYVSAEDRFRAVLLPGSRTSGAMTDEPGVVARLSQALKDFRAALSAQPNSVSSHARVADALLDMKQYDVAIHEYALAIKEDGSDESLVLGQAQARLALGDIQGAWNDIMKVLARMSSIPCGRRLLSKITFSLRDPARARHGPTHQ